MLIEERFRRNEGLDSFVLDDIGDSSTLRWARLGYPAIASTLRRAARAAFLGRRERAEASRSDRQRRGDRRRGGGRRQ
jgi:hypothetical protein